MANCSDVTFTKTLSTLQQICSRRRREFPFVVRTRDKMVSFMEAPIETEGKVLLLERQMAVKYARVKVLPFHDENKMISEHGAEVSHLHSSYVGEEFYIPLGCPGSLKVVPYPGKRQIYATVKEIMKQNPRYLRSNADVMTNTPKAFSDSKCMKRIPSGTIIEPKEVISHNKCRYLKCFDSNGKCCFLLEDSHVNFTGRRDERDYILEELCSSGVRLPSPVQFNPGTISSHDVTFVHSDMTSKLLVITFGPLEVIEVVSLTMLVAKLKDQCKSGCFKTALVPTSIYKHFRVQLGEFPSVEEKSVYLERNFGGCCGDNDFILNSMYLLPPVMDKLVCWIRPPGQTEHDSVDTDVDCELPDGSVTKQKLSSPLPVSGSDKLEEYRHQEEQLNEMHTVVLTPQLKVKDEDTRRRLKQKAKLGFGQVHVELKRLIKRKRKPKSPLNSPLDCAESTEFPTKPEPDEQKEVGTDLKSIEEGLSTDPAKEIYQTESCLKSRPLPILPRKLPMAYTASDSLADLEQKEVDRDLKSIEECLSTDPAKEIYQTESCLKSRPLPLLPRKLPTPYPASDSLADFEQKEVDRNLKLIEEGLSTDPAKKTCQTQSCLKKRPLPLLPGEMVKPCPAVDSLVDIEYVDMAGMKHLKADQNPLKVTARVQPLSNEETTVMPVNSHNKHTETAQSNQRHLAPQTSEANTLPRNPVTHDENVYLTMASNKRDLSNDSANFVEEGHSTSPSFFTYSVQATVDCLTFCGLKELAELCDEQKLDGDFFKGIDETELRELFNLSRLTILKLRKIYDGWRPKF